MFKECFSIHIIKIIQLFVFNNQFNEMKIIIIGMRHTINL